MSGLCGWLGGGADARHGGIGAMAETLTRFDAAPVHVASTAGGGVAASGTEGHASVFQDGTLLYAVWGRPRFEDAALTALAHLGRAAEGLAQGYARRNSDILATLTGSYALAIVDPQRGVAVLATDRLGTRSLCYSASGDSIVFGSTLDAISACSMQTPDIELQAIYDYVHFHMVPAPLTAHAGHYRLDPGTYLVWRNGHTEIRSYWRVRFVEDDRQPYEALKAQFRSILRESVRQASTDGPVGAFLSGGTDSSTIAGMLTDVTGEPAATYSIGFDARGYDEMQYARIAARHFRTRHHEYYVTPEDVAAAIPHIAAVHDQPYGNASAVPTYYCAKLAKSDGVDTLLGGDGGDELFGGNDRYAKQYLYSLYSDLPSGLRRHVIEPLAFLPPPVGVVGKVQRYMRHASEPMPQRYDNHNLLEHFGPKTVFTDDFLSAVDTGQPQRLVGAAYRASSADSLINRMLALDLRFTLADNDLPKVTRSCELARVDVRFPMLDDALVDFAARLPPRYKLNGTRLRHFFKEALRDYLPPEIIAKKKHGFGLPFGMWLQSNGRLRQVAQDSLSDLKRRNVVRSAFIDELGSVYAKQHPAYYGTMVWILMMLEQWFARRSTGTHRRYDGGAARELPRAGVPAL